MTRYPVLFASCLAALLAVPASGVAADPPADIPMLSPRVQQLTCAPRLLSRDDGDAARVLGGRDRESPGMFAPREVIVTSTGGGAPLAAGQLYVAYRRPRSHVWTGSGGYVDDAAQNAGVVRVEAVTGNKATATIVWACDGIDVGDRLEPFVATEAPATDTGAFPADVAGTPTVPDAAAQVQFGQQDRFMGAARDLVLVSRVDGQAVQPGQRVGFFRRYQGKAGPVTMLGEGVVQAVHERTYVVQIAGSRDAVEAGDLVAAPGR